MSRADWFVSPFLYCQFIFVFSSAGGDIAKTACLIVWLRWQSSIILSLGETKGWDDFLLRSKMYNETKMERISVTSWLWWQTGFQMTQIHKCKSALQQDVNVIQGASATQKGGNKGLLQICLRFWKLLHQHRQEIKWVNGHSSSSVSFSSY